MTPWTVACQAALSLGILQVRILERLPCPPPGDFPNPGIEPRSPALQADSLLTEPPGKPSLDYGPLQAEKVSRVQSEIVALCYVKKI